MLKIVPNKLVVIASLPFSILAYRIFMGTLYFQMVGEPVFGDVYPLLTDLLVVE